MQKALNVRYWLRQFASDNEYGDWVKRSIPEKLNTAKKRTTLFYYRQLADNEQFGNWVSSVIPEKLPNVKERALLNYRQLAEFGTLLKNVRTNKILNNLSDTYRKINAYLTN